MSVEGIDRHGIPEGAMSGGRGPLLQASSPTAPTSTFQLTSNEQFSWGDELTQLGEEVVKRSGFLPRRPRARHLITKPMSRAATAIPHVGVALASVQAGILLGGIWLTGIGSALRIKEHYD